MTLPFSAPSRYLWASLLGIFIVLQGASQSFAPREMISARGFGYNTIKAFDADQDGDMDLICFPDLYLNDGKGKPQKKILLTDSVQAYETYELADLDKDKDKDIVVLYKNGKIRILLNEAGGFKEVVQKGKVDYSPAEYAKLWLYDANADGICDVMVTSNQGPPVAYVGDKDHQFSYFKPFNQQFKDLGYVIGYDVNRDGIQELILGPENLYAPRRLRVYTYTSKGYVLKDTLPLPVQRIKQHHWIDMDKDGDEDLVYASEYDKAGVYWSEVDKKNNLKKVHTLINNVEMYDAYIGDYDNDGDMDVAYSTGEYQHPNMVWQSNIGNGQFDESPESPFPGMRGAHPFLYEDFDGDKIKDVGYYDDYMERARAFFKVSLLLKKGMKENTTWIINDASKTVLMEDLNKDGIKDLVGYYSQEVFCALMDNTGKLTQERRLFIAPFEINGLDLADMDKDGNIDFILSSDERSGDRIGWCKNLGELKMGPYTSLHKGSGRVLNFDIMDYDNDKQNDLVLAYFGRGGKNSKDNKEKNGVYVYHNDGAGIFAKAMQPVMETSEYVAFNVVDVNEDGVEDILENSTGRWFSYSADTWTKRDSIYKTYIKNTLYQFKADKDAYTDYLVQEFGRLTWYEHGSTWKDTLILKNVSTESLKIADMDGDGLDDIVYYSSTPYMTSSYITGELLIGSKYSISLLHNDGTGNFSVIPICPIEENSNLELADIDQDGDVDIIVSGLYWPHGGWSVIKNLSISR